MVVAVVLVVGWVRALCPRRCRRLFICRWPCVCVCVCGSVCGGGTGHTGQSGTVLERSSAHACKSQRGGNFQAGHSGQSQDSHTHTHTGLRARLQPSRNYNCPGNNNNTSKDIKQGQQQHFGKGHQSARAPFRL